ncbi:MAG: Gldg family protein [Clostridia bacterium]|nr:Gldg family protein [Clostridia bacterium]
MKKLLNLLRSRLSQPKWRHGRLGTLVMVLVIVVAVLLTALVQSAEDTYGLRRDLSFNHYATTGKETEAAMARLQNDVELYLLYQNGEENSQLMQVLDRYGVLSDHIAVLPTDINRNPGILTRFSSDPESPLEADTVVVNCPATGRFRVLNYGDFYTQGYDIELGDFVLEGINYEKKLTEAILYTANDSVPMVGFLQGHGEYTLEDFAVLVDFLRSYQYDACQVNLLAGDTLDGIHVLLLGCPVNDLDDTEIEQIKAFAQNGGNLFVVRDYTDPVENMPNYLSLLRSYGVVPLKGVAVAGAQDSGSYYGETLYLLPYMAEIDLTLPLIASGMDVLMMPAACAFELPPEPGTGDLTLSVGTVLKTGPNAYLRDTTDGLNTIDQQPGDRTGELPLALFAHRMHANGNVSRLFAIGNSAMLMDSYIYQRTFGEQFVMAVMNELMPENTISLDIVASAAFRPGLTAGSQGLGIGLIITMPLLCLVAALVVLLPRRNR